MDLPDVIAPDTDSGGHLDLRVGQLFDIILADDYESEHNQLPAAARTSSP